MCLFLGFLKAQHDLFNLLIYVWSSFDNEEIRESSEREHVFVMTLWFIRNLFNIFKSIPCYFLYTMLPPLSVICSISHAANRSDISHNNSSSPSSPTLKLSKFSISFSPPLEMNYVTRMSEDHQSQWSPRYVTDTSLPLPYSPGVYTNTSPAYDIQFPGLSPPGPRHYHFSSTTLTHYIMFIRSLL